MIFVVLFVAGCAGWFVSTIGGGGGALIVLPLVGFVAGVQAAAPVVTLGTFVANPFRIVLFWRHIAWEIMAWYIPAAIVGSFLGARVFSAARVEWLQIALGLFLISTIFQYRFGERARTFVMKRWYFLPVGFCVSFISGLVGAAGPVLNPFYLNYGLVKERMVATKAANAFVMHITKIATYGAFGAYTRDYVIAGLVLGIGAIGGTYGAKRAFVHINETRFRQIVIAVMAASGAIMIWQQRDYLLRLIVH